MTVIEAFELRVDIEAARDHLAAFKVPGYISGCQRLGYSLLVAPGFEPRARDLLRRRTAEGGGSRGPASAPGPRRASA